jgi:hypothetical protein
MTVEEPTTTVVGRQLNTVFEVFMFTAKLNAPDEGEL